MSCRFCDPDKPNIETVGESGLPYIRIEIENFCGDVRILAHGDNDDYYTPKFCPECGRRLISEKLKGEKFCLDVENLPVETYILIFRKMYANMKKYHPLDLKTIMQYE